MITCMIVDDEEMAIERLQREIEQRPGWEIVAIAQEYSDAQSKLLQHRPDVCFMDINIIAGSGMALATQLHNQIATQWIFSTAYDEYAIDAFEIDAVGYLLKPFENHKLFKLMHKVEQQANNDAETSAVPVTKIAVKSIGEVCLVDFKDVIWIKGASNYVELHCQQKVHLHRATIRSIEDSLPKDKFFRVHRSAIINLDYVKKIGSEMGRYSVVIMNNDDEVKISNAYKSSLFNLLGISS